MRTINTDEILKSLGTINTDEILKNLGTAIDHAIAEDPALADDAQLSETPGVTSFVAVALIVSLAVHIGRSTATAAIAGPTSGLVSMVRALGAS